MICYCQTGNKKNVIAKKNILYCILIYNICELQAEIIRCFCHDGLFWRTIISKGLFTLRTINYNHKVLKIALKVVTFTIVQRIFAGLSASCSATNHAPASYASHEETSVDVE